MRNEKTVWPRFALRERKNTIRFLEAQARKGWLFCGFGGLGWKLRRIEPQNLHFAIVYFTPRFQDDREKIQRLEEFREFCAHDGWQFAGDTGCMQVFYTDKDKPTPIETDPALEVESIWKAQEHGESVLMLFGLVILAFLLYWWDNEGSLILFLTDQESIWTILYALTGCVLIVFSILQLRIWHRKALKYADERNEFLDESAWMIAQKWISLIWVLLASALLVFVAGWRVYIWRAITWGLVIVLCGIANNRIQSKDRDRKKSRKKPYLASIMIFSVVLTTVNLTSEKLNYGYGFQVPENSSWIQYMDVPPLVADETDDYTITLRETGFLARYHVEGEESRFSYTVLDVKVIGLYDTCLNEMLPKQYFSVDATPWQAISAYQYGVSEYMCNSAWLLCYEDRIVEIRLETEPTPEQMALIGETLGGK